LTRREPELGPATSTLARRTPHVTGRNNTGQIAQESDRGHPTRYATVVSEHPNWLVKAAVDGETLKVTRFDPDDGAPSCGRPAGT
jgi:hypothetical protein